MRSGRLISNGRPCLEVPTGVPGGHAEHVDRILEPFFMVVGERDEFFLAREPAQTDGTTLLYEPRHGGGSAFRLVFAIRRKPGIE